LKPKSPKFWLFFLVIAGLTITLSRCGKTEDKDDEDSKKPTEPSEIPSDWDGTSDWSGSPFKVVEE
jgi:hypothetical protein